MVFVFVVDGVFDYANQWVLSAFEGSKTSFSNGNADFSLYSFTGKTGKPLLFFGGMTDFFLPRTV
jgi:hypothetical protein